MLTDDEKAKLLELLGRLVVALEAIARARGKAAPVGDPPGEPRHTP